MALAKEMYELTTKWPKEEIYELDTLLHIVAALTHIPSEGIADLRQRYRASFLPPMQDRAIVGHSEHS